MEPTVSKTMPYIIVERIRTEMFNTPEILWLFRIAFAGAEDVCIYEIDNKITGSCGNRKAFSVV